MSKQETMTSNEFQALIQGKAPASNQKVRNAVKTERYGVTFDSRLECHMYGLLKLHEIPFEFQKRYVLQEGFDYNGDKIRAITYTIDFELTEIDMAIDTKGILTQQGTMRIKMLKRLFADMGRQTQIELPRTKDECNALTAKLINR